MNIKIVRATPDDVELVSEIGIQTYVDHYTTIWSEQGLKKYLHDHFNHDKLSADLNAESVHYYFAHVNKEPIGILKFKFEQKIPLTSDYGLELEKIYLLKNQVGKGIGHQLMDFSISLAKENECNWIWLDVLKSNHGGYRFYTSFGFSVVGEIEFATDTTDIGMYVMRLKV